MQPRLNEPRSQEVAAALENTLRQASDPFVTARAVAQAFLGSRKSGDRQAQFGFWVPGLHRQRLAGQAERFRLELFLPQSPLQWQTLAKGEVKTVSFQRVAVPLVQASDYLVAVVDDIPIGSPEQDGALYWLVYTQPDGGRFLMRDPLVQSAPLGVYAPAEVYDIEGLLAARRDMDYFRSHYRALLPDGSYRAKDIGITLEIHAETATQEGTLAALTETYRTIGEKIQRNLSENRDPYAGLSPAELNFVAFDTVELTPEVPPVEREGETSVTGEFFQILEENGENVSVALKKPDISNWGYDTPIIGTAAVNPSILRSGRPHEFLEFIETLHTMPHRPIQISLDAVLGHADFQGARLLATPEADSPLPGNLKYIHSAYFRGANMYGRDLDYANPVVRAILLEMYRRKVNFGFDCVRVDGGQDFVKTIDPETDFRIQDDAFIGEMVRLTQQVNGLARRLDMNVEDGRPWPNDLNWLYNATYVEHILMHPLEYGDRVKQWGSLIFAHNVHGKFKWFQTKWDRFKDTFKDGQDWITGHSNHDNARYYYRLVKTRPGSQFEEGDTVDDYYNDPLGPDRPSATHTALDNPALSALVLGLLPGSPMFFLNALFRTPWLFFRNTDHQYGVKVVADEGGRFLTWYIGPDDYAKPENFPRLKRLGFERLGQLVRDPDDAKAPQGFMDVLFELHEKIKTDPTTALFLFDDPAEFGGFRSVEELRAYAERLSDPLTDDEKRHVALLETQIARDSLDSQRKVAFLSKFVRRTLQQQPTAAASPSEDPVTRKLLFLNELVQSRQNDLLALLMEDAALRDGYSIADWGRNPALLAAAPASLLENGVLPEATLKAFALAFMQDAKDVCLVSRYANAVDARQTEYNLRLRRYRQENPWLAANPVNDVAKDFFNRKILANGAKNTGAFFSDKGDTLNANTLYYGWRTHPEGGKQVFLLANMEGRPIARLPLADFLPAKGPWRRVVASPGLGALPEVVDASLVLYQVTNGQALLLERDL